MVHSATLSDFLQILTVYRTTCTEWLYLQCAQQIPVSIFQSMSCGFQSPLYLLIVNHTNAKMCYDGISARSR